MSFVELWNRVCYIFLGPLERSIYNVAVCDPKTVSVFMPESIELRLDMTTVAYISPRAISYLIEDYEDNETISDVYKTSPLLYNMLMRLLDHRVKSIL